MKTHEIVAALTRRHASSDRPGQTGIDAALRRMDPAAAGAAAMVAFRALADAGLDLDRQRPERLSAWLLIIHVLALARWRHQQSTPTGQALVAIRLGEARLKQLLSADFETLQQLMPRLARRFAAQSDMPGMDFVPLARLVLAASQRSRDLEQARLEIALSYTRYEQEASTDKRKAS